eukprot:763271-Hanusia_phi.AAC.2
MHRADATEHVAGVRAVGVHLTVRTARTGPGGQPLAGWPHVAVTVCLSWCGGKSLGPDRPSPVLTPRPGRAPPPRPGPEARSHRVTGGPGT